jgi:hypothetical protein
MAPETGYFRTLLLFAQTLGARCSNRPPGAYPTPGGALRVIHRAMTPRSPVEGDSFQERGAPTD